MWLKKKTRINRPEQAHCCALMEAIALHAKKRPELNLLYHIPNGGKRTIFEAKMFKGMGVKAGVLDYCLPVPKRPYPGMYLEMKSESGRLSDSQQWWREQLTNQGYKVVVAYDWESALEAILNYLNGVA